MQKRRTWHSSVLFSPEPYLYRVNICVRVTFTLPETFTNKSTNAAFKKGMDVFRAEDPVTVNSSSYCFQISAAGSSITPNL